MLRRGATAAAGDADAFPDLRGYILSKFFRGYIVEGLSVNGFGQSRIGLQQHRDGSVFQILLHHRAQRLGAKGAVDTNGIGAHTFQHGYHGSRRSAGHQFAIFAVGIGDKYWQVAIFLRCQQSGFGFVAVSHGFDEDQIGAVFHTQTDGLGKDGNGILKVQIAIGLQHLSRGADVQRHPFFLRRGTFLGGGSGVLQGGLYDFFQFCGGEFQTVGAKGVGIHHMTAGVEICPVDFGDDLRVTQVPPFRVFSGLQPLRLQQGTHAAVQKQQMFFDIVQNIHSILLWMQSVLEHCTHPVVASRQLFPMPMMAVTDLEGDISRLSLRVSPICLGQSRTRKISC